MVVKDTSEKSGKADQESERREIHSEDRGDRQDQSARPPQHHQRLASVPDRPAAFDEITGDRPPKKSCQDPAATNGIQTAIKPLLGGMPLATRSIGTQSAMKKKLGR